MNGNQSMKRLQFRKKKDQNVHFKVKVRRNKNTKEKKIFVTCQHNTENGPCKKTFPYVSESTGMMVSHLRNKHKFECTNKDEVNNNQTSGDACFLLMMFIITSSLPFRCVDNEFFKKFCKCLNLVLAGG